MIKKKSFALVSCMSAAAFYSSLSSQKLNRSLHDIHSKKVATGCIFSTDSTIVL